MPLASRRFIAGARCPNCQEIDRICYQKDSNMHKYECVNCGFAQEEPTHAGQSSEAGDNLEQ